VEIIGALSPRVRELLVVLAVHPEGITRDRLADTLWPDSPPGRPFNNLNTNLGRLRTALAGATGGMVTEIVLTAGDHHCLNPALIDVDYQAFTDAARARQLATSDAERIGAWHRMVATYRGELAEGLGTEWLETPREAIRRDAVDAATGLARLLVRDDPRQALDLLEAARSRDPYNEQLYGDIMRVQRRLGQADAIGRTLSLLAARLAELQETPSPETVALAEALQRAVSRRSEPDRSGDAAVR
jgi:DNA-binding SARP family transcriptional activator